MKKTAQATTAAAVNEEAAKTTLKIVGAEEKEPQGITVADESKPESPLPATMTEAFKIAVPFQQRQEAIEALHRQTLTLDRLKEDYAKLKEFEIDLKEDPENTENEYLNTCTFKITDDKGRYYAAKSPQYISECLSLLKGKMENKIKEMENEIVWPF